MSKPRDTGDPKLFKIQTVGCTCFFLFPVTQIIAPLQSQTMRTKRGGLYSRDLSEGEADLALGPPR